MDPSYKAKASRSLPCSLWCICPHHLLQLVEFGADINDANDDRYADGIWHEYLHHRAYTDLDICVDRCMLDIIDDDSCNKEIRLQKTKVWIGWIEQPRLWSFP